MDKNNLEGLLHDMSKRQFWLKAIGQPKCSENWDKEEKKTWEQDPVRTEFSRRLSHDFQGDIFIAYRVRIRKVIYVAECFGELKEATEEEMQREKGRRHWRWYWWGHNLTPEYGLVWNQVTINPFDLKRRFNAENPDDAVNLGAINAGNGIANISCSFAELLIQQIAMAKK